MSEYFPTNSTPEQPKADNSLVNNSEIDLSYEPFKFTDVQKIKDINNKMEQLKIEREKYRQLTNPGSIETLNAEDDANNDSTIKSPIENQEKNNIGPKDNNETDEIIARLHVNLEAQRQSVIQAEEEIGQ